MTAAAVSLTRVSSLARKEALPIAGFAGVLVLVVVTSIARPAWMVVGLGLTAMAVVVAAWVGLGRRRTEFSVNRLYWIAAAWCLPLLVARPLFSGDVHSYSAQGMIAANGGDPYQLGPVAGLGADSPVTQAVSPYWQNTPAPYGPVAVTISRAIAVLVGENQVATVLANRLVEIVGVVLIAWALPRLARRTGVPETTALWLGLLNPLLLWHAVAGVHNEGLMLGLMLAGLEIALSWPSRPGRVIAGVVLLTIAANIKIVAVVALLCLGIELARRHGPSLSRALLVQVALFAGFAALSLAIAAGTGLGLGWIGTVGGGTQVHSWLAPTNQIGLLIGAIGGTGLTSPAIAVCIRIGALAGAVGVMWFSWKAFRDGQHALVTLGQVFAVMLVTGPVVQPWYLLWAIVPWAAAVRTRRARRGMVAASAAFAMVLPPVTGGVGELITGYLVAIALLGLGWAVFRARSVRREKVDGERESRAGVASAAE